MHHVHTPRILSVIHRSWTTLWTSKVGQVPLRHFNLDAQVIGKFFQELMLHELRAEDPRWRSGSPKEKDFTFADDESLSFELKMCGQVGSRDVFGNRCSAAGYASPAGKDRSGWLLTINYTGQTINIIRLGWISGGDWVGQRAASGNSSKLSRETYGTKLRVLRGDYQRAADIRVLTRVGKKLYAAGIETVGQAADLGVREALDFLNADFI